MPCIQILGSCTQSVRPVVASMAATWLADVLTYRTPPTINAVASFAHVRIPGCEAISSRSGDVQRQAIRSCLTLSRVI